MRCLSYAVASNSARRVLAAAMLWDFDSLCAWTHWDLNPGPSACEADVIPLHHVPLVECAEMQGSASPEEELGVLPQ